MQAAPIYLNLERSVEKTLGLISEAASQGAKLVVFPEAFVPCYPFWVWHVAAGDTRTLRELYAELLDNSVSVPGEATDALCAAARESGIAVATGINEINTEGSGTTLCNSVVYIAAEDTPPRTSHGGWSSTASSA